MKYGDPQNVPKDVKVLFDIIHRQGSQLLFEIIAEHAGDAANRLKLKEKDRRNVIVKMADDFTEELLERL